MMKQLEMALKNFQTENFLLFQASDFYCPNVTTLNPKVSRKTKKSTQRFPKKDLQIYQRRQYQIQSQVNSLFARNCQCPGITSGDTN